MMQRSALAVAATAVLFSGVLGAHPARASSTTLRLVPVALANEHGTPGRDALMDDPNLANQIIYTLTVSVPVGFDWTNSEIRVQLTSGTIYNATGPAGTQSSPNQENFTTVGRRHSAYDTFVNSKPAPFDPSDPTSPIVLQPAVIIGKLNPDHTAGEPPPLGLSGQGQQVLSVAWGNTVGGEDGTFQIGQFTVSADADGTFFGRTYSSDQPGGAFHVFQGRLGLFIPEPSGLVGLLLCGLGLLRRRTAAPSSGPAAHGVAR